jgi:hypothetical protein
MAKSGRPIDQPMLAYQPVVEKAEKGNKIKWLNRSVKLTED